VKRKLGSHHNIEERTQSKKEKSTVGEFQFRIPELVITDPILLWLFNHGWEDPGWGQTEANQLTLALALHQLAERITDPATRGAIQIAAVKAVATLSRKVVGGSGSGSA
jgi:hypothetical protein